MSIKRFFREMLWETVVAVELRLMLPSSCADIEPPIGPAISQFGINATDLIERFNELTSDLDFEPFNVMFNVKAYRDISSVGDFYLIIDSYTTGSVLESICNKFFTKRVRRVGRPVLFIRDLVAFSRFRFLIKYDKSHILSFPGCFPFFSLSAEFNTVYANAISLNHSIVWF